MNPINHVAIIMDGNGRWGLKKKKSRNSGHKAGLNTVENIIKHTIKNNIKFLTLYAFSTENWKRPQKEISFLFNLLQNFLKKKTNKLQINLALNYGAKNEILNAISLIKKKKISFTENNINKNLYTNDSPNPDILIRTGNTKRLSNFLLWQIAYTEIFFEKKLWPEFSTQDYNRILEKFKQLKRNFGNIE